MEDNYNNVGRHPQRLTIIKRDSKKARQTTVGMRVSIDTYQKVEKAANEANYSMIEMLDELINYAIKNLDIK